MSISQNIDNTAVRFSARVGDANTKALAWAKSLKLRKAFVNLFVVMPIMAIPWLLGRMFFYLKYLFGLLYFAFRQGAKME